MADTICAVEGSSANFAACSSRRVSTLLKTLSRSSILGREAAFQGGNRLLQVFQASGRNGGITAWAASTGESTGGNTRQKNG